MALNTETEKGKEESVNIQVKKTFLKFGNDILVSATTNRPVKEGESGIKPHIFWCEICKVKLTHPMSAIGHFSGRHHLGKADFYLQKTNSSKRKQTTTTPSKSEPAAKVKKTVETTPRGGATRGSQSTNKRGGLNSRRNRSNYSNTAIHAVSSHFGMQYQSNPGDDYGSHQWGSANSFGMSQEHFLPYSKDRLYYGSLDDGYQRNNQARLSYTNQQAYDRASYYPKGPPLQSRGNFWRD